MTRKTNRIIKNIVMLLCLALLCTFVWIRSSRTGASRKGLGSSFEFDLEQYLDVDPAIVKYEEIAPLKTGLAEVLSLAVRADRIYVGGSSVIIVLDSKGS